METRKLAIALTTYFNAMTKAGEKLAETLEGLTSAAGDDDDDGDEKSGKAKKGSRKDETPSEDDVIDAVRAAQKVLESADIKKILKKYGKADRAREVEEDNRQAVLDALEKAIEEADED